ncbi:ATP-grasp domain-containing protein [Pseudomonas sp. KU43P]|uniref:ATP-grasp domain-containing protein n=1 Tax=Pseudomonas sp. KU43P TaxID=2487887 RepID=UPI0012AA7155|nr:ATP-grasp domain-containing protein [Pseudomonas sp. KU43P]BBH45426.1 hypothetical protein KU43P_19030 [Pseudomonas sp. KU43P]
MNGRRSAIVIVDPVSSARHYGSEIRSKGLIGVALISVAKLSEGLRRLQDLSGFEVVVYAGSFELAVCRLAEYEICAVIPGSDLGLGLSDMLNYHYGLVGNPVISLKSRMCKLELKKTLEYKNVPATHSIEVSLKSIERSQDQNFNFPLVVKPSQGTGSKNVKVCKNLAELSLAISNIEGNHDFHVDGEVVALAEEYIEGIEYFVVTANLGKNENKIFLCFAKYEKIECSGNLSIYKNIMSLPLSGDNAQLAFSYACDVNEAIELDYGINDIELKIGPKGVLIIEQNGRLPGADVPRMIELCSGFNCYDFNLDIYLGKKFQHTATPRFNKHFCICCLISTAPGEVKSISGVELVSQLSSFNSMNLFVSTGQRVEVTRDFLSSWGMVYLVHENRELLAEHAELVHQLLRLNM